MGNSSVAFAMGHELDLSRDAVLVKLKISQVGVTANSKTLSLEAAAVHSADKNSVKGYVQKIKWADLSELTAIYNKSREMIQKYTLPWSEEFRLCPVENYSALTKEMRELGNSFEDAVLKLVERHDALEEDYVNRVGHKLAQETQFPTREQMQKAFSFTFEESLIPSNDVRLRHVSQEEREKIQKRTQDAIAQQLGESQKEVVTRLQKVVERIANSEKVHASTFEALEETLEVLPSLNIGGDAKIDAVIKAAKKALGGIDVEAFRKDEATKEAVKSSAGTILDDLKSFTKKV